MVRSWKREFDNKYARVVRQGDIDKANRIVLEAIARLDKLLPKRR